MILKFVLRPIFPILTLYIYIDIYIYIYTLAQYIFHVYLVANPKRELEFKMVVTVGLQDISSMYITLETSYVFILYVYYSRFELTGFCQRRPS